MQDVISKIRKLLLLAGNDGATEAEAETAMAMATFLMTKHGIESVDATHSDVGRDEIDFLKNPVYQGSVVYAAAVLNACRSYVNITPDGYKLYRVVGEKHNREACKLMYEYLCKEVEKFYKIYLPKGMTQRDRANFRRTFKFACARRLSMRAKEIVRELQTNEQIAQEHTGSTALVVSDYFTNQLNEIGKWLTGQGITLVTRKSKGRYSGLGTSAGSEAGDNINLQRSLT